MEFYHLHQRVFEAMLLTNILQRKILKGTVEKQYQNSVYYTALVEQTKYI